MKATTKTEIGRTADRFFHCLADLTGGTHAEVVKQAPHGLERLTLLAGEVSELLTRPGKRLLEDQWLMERAMSVAGRLEKYRETWYAESQRPAPAPVDPPANVVPFALAAAPEPVADRRRYYTQQAMCFAETDLFTLR
jgi:hypothetical protein